MGYYSNLHISRQQDYDHFDCSEWGDMNEYLLEDLCAELEICNAHRSKDWNDQYFAVGLSKATALRGRIERMQAAKNSMAIICISPYALMANRYTHLMRW